MHGSPSVVGVHVDGDELIQTALAGHRDALSAGLVDKPRRDHVQLTSDQRSRHQHASPTPRLGIVTLKIRGRSRKPFETAAISRGPSGHADSHAIEQTLAAFGNGVVMADPQGLAGGKRHVLTFGPPIPGPSNTTLHLPTGGLQLLSMLFNHTGGDVVDCF